MFWPNKFIFIALIFFLRLSANKLPVNYLKISNRSYAPIASNYLNIYSLCLFISWNPLSNVYMYSKEYEVNNMRIYTYIYSTNNFIVYLLPYISNIFGLVVIFCMRFIGKKFIQNTLCIRFHSINRSCQKRHN